MKNKNLWIGVGVVIIALIIVGVVWVNRNQGPIEPVPVQPEYQEYKVGAVVFLTGDQATLGEYVKDGLELAEEEINASGGVNGRKIKVVYADSQDTPRVGIDAFNKLLSVDQVPVVISTGTAVTRALIPLADERQVPLLATVAAEPGIPEKSEWVFRIWITTVKDAETLADFALEKTPIRKVVGLYLNSEYGTSWWEAFKSKWEAGKGSILGSESYEIADSDLRPQLLKLKQLKPEAVVLTGFGPAYGVAIKQMRELGIDARLLTNPNLDDQTIRKQVGSAAAGALFTTSMLNPTVPQTDMTKHFSEEFKSRYGREPNFIAGLPYDCLHILAKSIEAKGYSSSLIREGLLSIQKYEGIMGTLQFSPQREMGVPIVVRGFDGTRIVEPSVVLSDAGKEANGK